MYQSLSSLTWHNVHLFRVFNKMLFRHFSSSLYSYMNPLSYHVVSKICSHMYQVITEVKLRCVFMSLTSIFVLVLETGFHCVAQADLELIT